MWNKKSSSCWLVWKVNIYINFVSLSSQLVLLFAWQTNNRISYLLLCYIVKSIASLWPTLNQKKKTNNKKLWFIFFTSLNANKIYKKKEFKTFVYPLLCFYLFLLSLWNFYYEKVCSNKECSYIVDPLRLSWMHIDHIFFIFFLFTTRCNK